MDNAHEVYRGVNLGGWLILERWMTPSVFAGLEAKDEFSFCHEASDAGERLARHHNTFITEEDLQWIASHGLNAVRLPVPHWLFGNVAPYVACVEYVDWLMAAAPRYGLSVLLDLHAAPGSQNGWDHSGKAGRIGWTDQINIDRTLEILGLLADRYKGASGLIGIELLNEPHPSVDKKLLLSFYEQGIERIRATTPGLRIVVSDAFRPKDWNKTSIAKTNNTALDMHLYQVFDAADKKLPIHEHLTKARKEWGEVIQSVQTALPVIVGEWSLGLDTKTFRGMDDFERDKALQAYGRAQLDSFDQSAGWFFWSYKTENMAGWSYREAVARGWLPVSYETSV
jgi:glucan 1,3-beta-glucosidase